MKTINIKEIIIEKLLDTNEVAVHLFPKNKYPRLALNRVMAGTAVLNADQISKFSLFSDVPIADLYEGKNWKAIKETGKEKVLILTSGKYRAELNTENWTTKLFHKDSLFHEFVMSSKTLTLREYTTYLDELIAHDSSTNY